MAVELKNMYDLYGLCAGRLVDLLDWLNDASMPAQGQQRPMQSQTHSPESAP